MENTTQNKRRGESTIMVPCHYGVDVMCDLRQAMDLWGLEDEGKMKNGKWFSVNSSNIKAFAVRANDLLIEFHSGSVYLYIDAAMMAPLFLVCESVGKLFHNEIKNKFMAVCLDEEKECRLTY